MGVTVGVRREFLHHYGNNGEEIKSMKILHVRPGKRTGFQFFPEVRFRSFCLHRY